MDRILGFARRLKSLPVGSRPDAMVGIRSSFIKAMDQAGANWVSQFAAPVDHFRRVSRRFLLESDSVLLDFEEKAEALDLVAKWKRAFPSWCPGAASLSLPPPGVPPPSPPPGIPGCLITLPLYLAWLTGGSTLVGL